MAYGFFVIFAVTALICSSIAEEEGCGANEGKFPCGRRCELSCNAPLPPYCKGLRCEPPFSCRCKDGYARDPETNQCVAIHECPVNECEVGEIKGACGKTCEGTCAAPFEPEICPRIRCANRDCRCDLYGGFVRDVSGRCIRKENCIALN